MTRYKVHIMDMQSHGKRVTEAERGRKMVGKEKKWIGLEKLLGERERHLRDFSNIYIFTN